MVAATIALLAFFASTIFDHVVAFAARAANRFEYHWQQANRSLVMMHDWLEDIYLTLNPEKTRIVPPDEGFTFLGHEFKKQKVIAPERTWSIKKKEKKAAKPAYGPPKACSIVRTPKTKAKQTTVEKLEASKAKAATMQTWLAFAVECGYVAPDEGQMHCELYGDALTEIEQLIRTATVVVKLCS